MSDITHRPGCPELRGPSGIGWQCDCAHDRAEREPRDTIPAATKGAPGCYVRDLAPGIRSSAHHRFGNITLDGTSMPVSIVVARAAYTIDGEAFRREYPHISDEQIRDALLFAATAVATASGPIAEATTWECAKRGCEWCGNLIDEDDRPWMAFERCPLACPHGDRCTREAGHEDGCNHRGCDCNEPNQPIGGSDAR